MAYVCTLTVQIIWSVCSPFKIYQVPLLINYHLSTVNYKKKKINQFGGHENRLHGIFQTLKQTVLSGLVPLCSR